MISLLKTKPDIKTWTIDDVKIYATEVSNINKKGMNKRIKDVISFIEKNNINGLKMIWLISEPHTSLSGSDVPHIAGKLKNLDPVLWKGIRWKEFLEPLIEYTFTKEKTCDDSSSDDDERVYSVGGNERIYSVGVNI